MAENNQSVNRSVPLMSTELKSVSEITLPSSIFARTPNDHAIYLTVRAQMLQRRRGTAKTKSRGEVHLSNAKPYRQKGTGRARQGTRRSPLLAGGGVIFGPKPRSYAISIPKKIRKLALKSILSQKLDQGHLSIVEELTIESGKTRDFISWWTALTGGAKDTLLIVVPQKDEQLWRATRNVGSVKVTVPDHLNAYDLLYYQRLVLHQKVIQKIEEVLG